MLIAADMMVFNSVRKIVDILSIYQFQGRIGGGLSG